MKKKIIFIFFLMALMIFGSYTIINAQEKVIITNDNGIEIKSKTYDKLKSMGYIDSEIKTLSREDYNKIDKIKIISTFNKNNEILENINAKTSSNSHEDMSTIKTNYKSFVTTVTYYVNEQGKEKIFAKINLDWLKNPKKRYEDVVTIYFSNNVAVTEKIIKDTYYPLISASITYNEIGKNNIVTTKSITYDGTAYDRYRIIDESAIVFRIKLPKKKKIKDIHISCSCEFYPMYKGFNAAGFWASYLHQKGRGKFNWKHVELKNSSPFFKYRRSIWTDDPTYDKPISSYLVIEK